MSRPVEIGPVPVTDGALLLRAARYADFPRWREVRLRNRRVMERYWLTSPLSWDERHTEWRWVQEVTDARRTARLGTGLAFVIEVDGELVGQVGLSGIDRVAGTAELGIWADLRVARRDVATLAACAVVDHAFDHLGLEVVTAPVSTRNFSVALATSHIGMVAEATMRGYSHVGGVWQDHDLLSVLATDRPVDGFVVRRQASRGEDEPRPAGTRPARSPDHLPGSRSSRVALARYTASRVRGDLRGRAPRRARPATVTTTVDGAAVTAGLRHLDRGRSAAEAYVDADVEAARSAEAATAALRQVVEHATGTLGLHRVSAVAAPDDGVRAAAYAAAGLRHEGTLRSRLRPDGTRGDLDLWARLADDPTP
ncbi:GNAT family protein [uncultured Nocardioides sp.]|uniref:GNAT family N-acetyltransferase n=1 Tax=uncultured Nocardioides sp. TaxID=198441 RepID=UPI002627E94A|nr:GNAT family protein [uncultured Nocardioides sp.]